MKKETSIAILLGIVFGIVLSIFMVSRTKNKSKILTNQKNTSNLSQIISSSSQSGNTFKFEVTSPSNNIIVETNSITISGKANSDTLIIIQSPIKDIAIKNSKEEFSTNMPLALGENVIHIVAYPKDTQFKLQEKELRVYYMEE